MAVKIILLILFFGVMMGIGVYARKHATDVNGFVLGGRSVGPWLTAFAYGTSWRCVRHVSGLDINMVWHLPGSVLGMQYLVRWWPG